MTATPGPCESSLQLSCLGPVADPSEQPFSLASAATGDALGEAPVFGEWSRSVLLESSAAAAGGLGGGGPGGGGGGGGG
eukprot:CAMPEP_0202782298 /NCGR_PEP_ID=MMETSP1388-20130828/62368_1 /ASSEMBLY_ACC=CAM_ASM_000864 /TAXON_ID=37098 /ORGANISM="Isochrysis sp, Strain CCMP1244" /LENGTH=78 /DNA_ID=CAMNT_0049451733 /DNA_START=49 /DNA_END=282 /DNA_ORIENTATION=+